MIVLIAALYSSHNITHGLSGFKFYCENLQQFTNGKPIDIVKGVAN